MLFFSEVTTPRILFFCRVLSEYINEEILPVNDISLLSGSETIINYSEKEGGTLNIIPEGLLSETGIRIQQPEVVMRNGIPYFFQKRGGCFDYDIPSMVFYMLSRYEEYITDSFDEHGRFLHTASLAYKNNFLHLPVVDIWLKMLVDELEKKTDKKYNITGYEFISTIDTDLSHAFLGRSLLHTFGSMIKKILRKEFANFRRHVSVLLGMSTDPFDTFEYLKETHFKHGIDAVFFFLVGDKGKYDYNLSYKDPKFISAVKCVSKWAQVGIHPSYQSEVDRSKISNEIHRLETLLKDKVQLSRQHFLKFRFPQTPDMLIENGISRDYSLGYAEIEGFRCGTGRSFPYFNLLKNRIENLELQPLILMDGTLRHYQKLQTEDCKTKAAELISICKKYATPFTLLWHNSSFSDIYNFNDGAELYEYIIKTARK